MQRAPAAPEALSKKRSAVWLSACAAVCVAPLLSGCGDGIRAPAIRINGSSTVYPITVAVVEEFGAVRPGVKIPVGRKGTGGGMKQFVNGEIDICNASRPIKPVEKEKLEAAGIEYAEFSVAFDGLSVITHKENDWLDCITVEQLKTIWSPEAADTINNWSQVDPDWPDQPLQLYGPGSDSGTFEYFTKVICGKGGASRPDYNASEDDNFLVRGIVADEGSLGYFGLAYYDQNKDTLKLIPVNDGDGCVAPSPETVRNGTYKPLSRPLFIYVRKDSLQRPEVEEFIRFYLDNAGPLAAETGYVPVSDEVAEANTQTLTQALAQ
ncbi:MAG: PstS family phosphate ABC transporter substrate-binding protein [Planctomycetota bacterium]